MKKVTYPIIIYNIKKIMKRILFFLMATLFSMMSFAQDVAYKTALFGANYNSKKISSYTDTWTATNDGFTVTIVNANNNNNGWEYIKMGRKNYASVGSITTNEPIDKPISSVTLTIDALTISKINSLTLKTSTDGKTYTDAGTFGKAKGEQTVELATPAANLYYQIVADCASGSSNGLITISKVQYFAVQEKEYRTISVTANPIEGTVTGAGEYEDGATATITATPNFDYVFVNWTLNGEVVSSEATYTFTVTADAHLEANFKEVSATTVSKSGVFSIAENKIATFATGNLQYHTGDQTWRFAKQQYQVVGEQNIEVGNPDFKGWIDMFGWSTSETYFGVDPSNSNELYDGEFVDWGTVFEGEKWSTLSADEWKYLLNTRKNATSLKQIATVDTLLGIMLFPDAWVMPESIDVTAKLDTAYDVNVYNYTIAQWEALEAAGAIFLPAAGRRTGGYGNMINYDQEDETREDYLVNGGFYRWHDNLNCYCYYWTSTINEKKNVSYLHNIVALGDDKYTIGVGAIWGEKGRYGQSVRLAQVKVVNHIISVSANNPEWGTITGAGEYEDGATATITATPNFDYVFVNWTLNGEVVSSEATYTFTVTADAHLEANFKEVSATTVSKSGVFSIAENKIATFATGNLQYHTGDQTWRFAKQQYQVVGEQNIEVGNPDFKGWIDMFGWSTSETYFGVDPSNSNELYDGEFVDWGTVFEGEKWSTLSADEWKYLLNTRKNATSLKQIATVDTLLGIMLFPDAWVMPESIDVTAKLDTAYDVNVYNYTIAQWEALEAAGAIFLPAAGRRTGGYGNMINYDQEDETREDYLVNGGFYRWHDNLNCYCYYWTSTINEKKNVSYLHNIVALGDDKYTIGVGAIWGEKGRYGQSVRLAQVELKSPITTALEDNTLVEQLVKILRDGQVLILKGDKIFNIMGQQVK